MGALLFLSYLNWLQFGGIALALGIIAFIVAAYYIASGIIALVVNNKELNKILGIISVVCFPVFMFIIVLFTLINAGKGFGPTGWVISLFTIIVAVSLVSCYLMAKLANINQLNKFLYLFAGLFALALVLRIAFDGNGDPRVLGNIEVINVAIYGVYCTILFGSLKSCTCCECCADKTDEEPKAEEDAE